MAKHLSEILNVPDSEWVTFPGGELEGKRPRRLCPACRKRLNGQRTRPSKPALCFQCYRLELEREKALRAAGDLNTASEARFQSALPFEPVNLRRLSMLKAERDAERLATRAGTGRFADRRRQAQMAARHALQSIAAGLRAQQAPIDARERVMAAVVHAAELQLPESWLSFVVSR
jgi:hypothetical protein